MLCVVRRTGPHFESDEETCHLFFRLKQFREAPRDGIANCAAVDASLKARTIGLGLVEDRHRHRVRGAGCFKYCVLSRIAEPRRTGWRSGDRESCTLADEQSYNRCFVIRSAHGETM